MQVSARLDIVRRSKILLDPHRLAHTPPHHLLGNADALILDLQHAPEGIPLRDDVLHRLAHLAHYGVDMFVRAPLGDLPHALERLKGAPLSGVALSAPSPDAVREVDSLLAGYDSPGSSPLQIDLLLDSPQALLTLDATASASPRVVSITVDEEGLLRALGVPLSPEVDQFFFPRGMALLVARLHGLQAHGLAFLPPHPDGSSPSLEERAVVARKLGLMGALCHTPEEAVALNKGFTPSPEEVQWCRKALWVLEDALRHGLGSATIEGLEMVDIAMLKHIRTLLQRESALCRKDAQKAIALGE
ncbi:Citrate lyase subunit beta [bacterium HR23]|nr:Citrate lyase subunit beta [bacterium HR23]